MPRLYTTEEYHCGGWFIKCPAKCGASQHHDSVEARKFSASEIIPEQKNKTKKTDLESP